MNATLIDGIEHQVAAFRSGFEEVLPVESLEYFHEEEIDILFRGTQEQWSVEKLNECVCFGHGYSRQSMQAQWLLEVLAEMDGHQQRQFLQFLTGRTLNFILAPSALCFPLLFLLDSLTFEKCANC